MGRAPGPDSPPTIAQSIPFKSRLGSGPRRGSSERNLIRAPVFLKLLILEMYLSLSTLTPIQMFAGHGSFLLSLSNRPERFVST